ncbi:MAG: hypothetical protein M3P44_13345 [Actinomycetota bacterium]|nr:hypothetical protein [Actinomycetota bacterium]
MPDAAPASLGGNPQKHGTVFGEPHSRQPAPGDQLAAAGHVRVEALDDHSPLAADQHEPQAVHARLDWDRLEQTTADAAISKDLPEHGPQL